MIRRIFILFIFLGMLASCGGKSEVRVPKNVLSKERLVPVLVDMQLLESALALGTMNLTNKAPGDTTDLHDLFKKNNTTKLQYEESMKFYSAHPDMLAKILDDVISELSKKQAEKSVIKSGQ